MIDLIGKRAVVCGSTQGIGRAVAETFARLGAGVTLVARNESVLFEVREQLACLQGQTHHAVATDFRRPAELRERMQQHASEHGPIDIVVNNTGGPSAGPIREATPEQFAEAFEMHVICNHVLTQVLTPGMVQRRWGRVINIISTSVREPIPGLGVSNTTRAAVAGWAKTLAGELAPFGVTVNNVLPGYTATARLTSLIHNRAQRQGTTPEAVEKAMIAQVPLGRFASAGEIAAGVAFLASDAASYITGISLPVDGGRIGSL